MFVYCTLVNIPYAMLDANCIGNKQREERNMSNIAGKQDTVQDTLPWRQPCQRNDLLLAA